MLLTSYDPFRDVRDLENLMFGDRALTKAQDSVATFSPHVNTREGEFAYHIDVDLPGVKKEDIKIDVKDNMLIISGERSFKNEVKKEDYYRVETSFGKFSRSFNLPDSIDTENIDASAENGVLEVVVPKLALKDNVRNISVK